MIINKSKTEKPIYIFLLALIINSLALIFSQNYLDGDTHSRTYMALQWLQDPFVINVPNQITWVFGPLHCYLNALILLIWDNVTLAPRVLSLLLTSLTIFPLFYSLEKIFGRREAFYTSLFFCFYTLFIHPAAIAASEGINLLLIFTSVYFYLCFHKSRKKSHLFLLALVVFLASMTRYESWFIAPFFFLLVVRDYNTLTLDKNSYRNNLSIVLLYGFISSLFITVWMGSCFLEFGDLLYFMHYSGNLDAPVIAKKLQEGGVLKLIGYNVAFLPGVMFLSFPFSSFLFAIAGVYFTIKKNFNNFFVWLLILYLVFYVLVFVFSLERYPLARFTTIPGALLFCFVGTGIVQIFSRLKIKKTKIFITILLVISALNLVFLSNYNQPSKDSISEKLRAISPITRQPDYFNQAAEYCQKILADDVVFVLDCRNYNDRLLYLSLYNQSEKIKNDWQDNKQLENYIRENSPEYILHTKYPRSNHALWELEEGKAIIAGLEYKVAKQFGIFTFYRLN